jgi:histone acetyltransferase
MSKNESKVVSLHNSGNTLDEIMGDGSQLISFGDRMEDKDTFSDYFASESQLLDVPHFGEQTDAPSGKRLKSESSELSLQDYTENDHTMHEDYTMETPSMVSDVPESEGSELDNAEAPTPQDTNDDAYNDNNNEDSTDVIQPDLVTLEDQEEKADREQIKREQEKKAKEREAQAARKRKVYNVSSVIVGTESGQEFVTRDAKARQEEKEGIIRFEVVTNDGRPESFILLVALKNIFSKQLPKMPRAYITRLVFDRNHKSLVLLKHQNPIGGICYRPFKEQGFIEIVFCAISQSEQVKGYGSHLMNHMKAIARKENIFHLITYADNFAIGYFKKQGFSCEIKLDRSKWAGYIKDYDGGTMMHCAMIPQIDYMEIPYILRKQKLAVLEKLQEVSNSHIRYAGITEFKQGAERIAIENMPGLRESGWNPKNYLELVSEENQKKLEEEHTALLETIKNDTEVSWPFLAPVDPKIAPGYEEIIKDPIDLLTIEKRLKRGYYITREIFLADLQRMVDNCKTYNAETTEYYTAAVTLEDRYLKSSKSDITT